VDRIAGALAPFVRPDAIVAILLSRDSAALYAAQLGVLKAGGAFCCLDPRFPDEHLSAVLDNAGAVALITDAAGRARLLAMGVPTPPMIDSAACESQGGVFVNGDTRPRHLAYVVYTSGTTGKPKGVLIEHRSIVNLVTSDVAYFGLTCDDRVAQCSSPA
jgi:non-ribosomal peptide synthetase component F